MSASTISTFELFALFPDEETARTYLEGRLWPQGPVCPQCGNRELIRRPKGFYRCNPCGKYTFSVREGTIFGRSKIPLHKWIYAMYLLVTARKGISSMQLAKEIGITQKSAWFMLQRLREACGNDDDISKLRGIVEVVLPAQWGGKRTGSGAKRSGKPRCPCGAMTTKRAKARSHKCVKPRSVICSPGR